MKKFIASLFLVSFAFFSEKAAAATVTVSTTADTVDGTTSSITALQSSPGPDGKISLREAVIAANNSGAGNTISIPAGTYQLTRAGAGETAASTGDLDILANNTTIIGAGPGVTIIQQTVVDRIIDVNPNTSTGFTFTIAGVTLMGGSDQGGFSGGAIIAGSTGNLTVVSNCVISGNTSSTAAGGISIDGGNAIITGCTITNNTAPNASGSGGGMLYSAHAANESLIVTNCLWVNNSAGSAASGGGAFAAQGTGSSFTVTKSSFIGNKATALNGGAICINSGLMTITDCSFATNAVQNASGHGGAVYSNAGTNSITYCRFVGNTAATAANGTAIFRNTGNAGSLTANDNWWGINTGPAANVAVSATTTTWLQLRHIPTSPTLLVNGATTLTADLLGRSDTTTIAAGNLSGLPTFPTPALTIFGSPALGTLSSAGTQLVNGSATATFTAGSTGGAGSVVATVDSQSVTANITIVSPAKATNITSTLANGSYTIGQVIPIVVIFDQAVTVTGTPQITLETGTSDAVVNYTSGSGTTNLTFNYTVASGQTAAHLDYVSTSALALNGGTIKNGGVADASLTLPAPAATGSLGANKSLVVDTTAPSVSSVTGPSGGSYRATQNLDFTVNYNEAVTVTGTPTIGLTIGATARNASYVSGSGTTSLLFRYTIVSGDNDSDGIASASPIVLNAGTIKDAAGNNAGLTFTPPTTTTVLVDTTTPTANVTGPSSGNYKAGQNLDFTVTYNESVSVTGTPSFGLTIGATGRTASYLSGSGTTILLFRYTVQAGDNDTDGITSSSPIALNSGTMKDNAGNDASLTFTPPTTTGVRVDTTAPSINGVTGPSSGNYNAGQNLDFSVTFNESVTVSGTPSIGLTIGATGRSANYISGSGSTTLLFRYTIQAGDTDADGIASASPIALNGGTIRDAALNDSGLTFTPPTTTGVLVDTTAPSVTGVTGPTSGNYHTGQNLDFTVSFNEAVTVGGTPSIGLTIGATGRSASYLSGSGSTSLLFRYTIQAGDTDTDGIASASPIALNSGTIRDAAANDASLTFTPPTTTGVLVDTTAPTISGVVGPTSGSYHAGQNLDFTVSYSEVVTVTGTPTIGLTIGATARNASYTSGSGSTNLLFRYTVQAGDADTDGIASASPIVLNGGTIRDAALNDAGLAFTPPTTSGVLVDTTAPSISGVVGPTGGSYHAGQNLDFTVTYNEVVTVSGTPSIGLTVGATARNANYVSGSGSTNLLFRYTVQAGDADTDGIASASPIVLNGGTIRDAAANDAGLTFTPPTTTSVLVDTTAPSVSGIVGPSIGNYHAGQNLDFTVSYNEVVTVVGTPSIGLTIGATARNANYVLGSGSTNLLFRYILQAGDTDADGIASASPIVLNGGTIRDAAANDASLTFTPPTTTGVLVDTTAPSISGVVGPTSGSYRAGQNLDFTVSYSEVVTVTGTPTIGLTIGATARNASYTSGTGTTNLLFRYTVQAGDTDADGIVSASPIVLNGGTIQDSAANNAGLTFTPPTTTAVLVDTTAPGLVGVIGPTNGSYRAGQNLDFSVVYNEVVIVVGTPSIGLTIGSTARSANYTSGSGGTNLLFRYTVQAGDLDNDGISSPSPVILNGGTIRDAAGNDAALAFVPPNTVGVLVDTIAPTISIGSPSTSLTSNGPVTFVITYGGADTITLTTNNITLNHTGTANSGLAVTGSSSTNRTVTLSGITGEGTLGISIAASTASDTAGNTALATGPSSTFTVSIPPTISAGPTNQVVNPGANVLFSVVAAGTSPFTYQWSKDGAGLSGQTNNTLALTNVGRADVGLYAVVVSNNIGNAISSNALLRVRIPQKIGTVSQLGDRSFQFQFRDTNGTVATLDYGTNYFEIRASTNLTTWQTITGNLSLTNGFMQFQDPASTNLPFRFYFIREE